MPRAARIVIPGVPHHVTNRGNNQQDIFFSNDDYFSYLNILRMHFNRYKLKLLAYCLMTNHIHLVVTPTTEKSLAEAMGKTQGHYTQYINKKCSSTGHLWENRFYSCPLDENHLIQVMRYVECNPVRAFIVGQAIDYQWSSASAHVSGKDQLGLLDMDEWRNFTTKAGLDWLEFIGLNEKEDTLEMIRQHTRSGRPL